MVKVPTGRFLKADEVKEGSLIKFVSEGEVVKSAFKGEDGSDRFNFQIDIELADGDQKTLTMNLVSRRAIIAAYGQDAKDWVGKMAVLSTALTPQNKKMILVNPTKTPAIGKMTEGIGRGPKVNEAWNEEEGEA